MNQLNLNKLYYFYVVAKEGSVKAASEMLNLTQPTISAQIKQLEEELGFPVFIRKHRKLELNRNGKYVLGKAEKLFNLANDLVNGLPSRGKAERVPFRIGAIQSLANSFIVDFSMKLWQDEAVKLSIEQGGLVELVRKLDKGKLDMVLTDDSFSGSKKYKSVHLGQDELVAVCSTQTDFNKREFPEALQEMPFISFCNQGRLQEDVDYFFKRNSLDIEAVGEVDDITLMRVVVERSDGFAVLPKRAVKNAVKEKRLKIIGTIPTIKFNLWAVMPRISENRPLFVKLLKDYFQYKN